MFLTKVQAYESTVLKSSPKPNLDSHDKVFMTVHPSPIRSLLRVLLWLVATSSFTGANLGWVFLWEGHFQRDDLDTVDETPLSWGPSSWNVLAAPKCAHEGHSQASGRGIPTCYTEFWSLRYLRLLILGYPRPPPEVAEVVRDQVMSSVDEVRGEKCGVQDKSTSVEEAPADTLVCCLRQPLGHWRVRAVWNLASGRGVWSWCVSEIATLGFQVRRQVPVCDGHRNLICI